MNSDSNIAVLSEQIKAIARDLSEMKADISEIKKQTIITNKRLSKVEYEQSKNCTHIAEIQKETEFVRFFSKRPKLAFLLLIGCISLISTAGITSLLQLLR